LGLFSVVTLLAHRPLAAAAAPATRQAAWYRKTQPTVADALASVRRELWRHQTFQTSSCATDVVKVPRDVLARLTEALCYVA
jgi:hypothetical protein